MTAHQAGGGRDGRRCTSCGQPLAAGAAFCRACGTRYEEPPPSPTVRRPVAAAETVAPRRPARTPLLAAAAILLLGAGAALAIALSAGGSSSTTVVVDKTGAGATTTAPRELASETIAAGRYVQAGSFKTVPHAEAERQRLAGLGIDVAVASSDGAQELYPGFQVLLGGPFGSDAEARALLKGLHANGVPSAFARDLSPALRAGGPTAVSGAWVGALERSSGEHPSLDGSLPVTLTLDSSGEEGSAEFPSLGCRTQLALESTGEAVFGYRQEHPCVGSGIWQLRPNGGELMVTLLPEDVDTLVLGTLSGG